MLKAMCENGESGRYGQQRHDLAAQEFADLLALHAKNQFEEGRRTLHDVKGMLRRYAQHTLVGQLNGALPEAGFTEVRTPFAGTWQWCIVFWRAEGLPEIHLEFGPTAVIENSMVADPVLRPDYSKVFLVRAAPDEATPTRIVQTDVDLVEILESLDAAATRLRDAALTILDSVSPREQP